MKDMMTITVSGAIHDYCSREPGKVESAARHDIPVLLQTGMAMSTPTLIDDCLLECQRRARQHNGDKV